MDQFDKIITGMESALERVYAFKDSRVKLPKAELDLLKTFEDARDIMSEMLKKTSADRSKLADMFGGDCTRISRIQVCIDGADEALTPVNAADQRLKTVRDAATSIEKVLEDMGFGSKLKETIVMEKGELTKRRTSIDAAAVAVAAAEHQAEEVKELETDEFKAEKAAEAEAAAAEGAAPPPAPVPEAPEPAPAAEPEKKMSPAEAAWRAKLDEDICARILACQAAEELQAFAEQVTAEKGPKTGNWMVWMVHRAHLNDPTLIKFDFTNLKMPAGDLDERISPKLVLAMEVNTAIEQLLLPCANLQGTEAACLAVSLRSNKTLKVLNIDSNALQPLEMESIANAIGAAGTLQELRCNNVSTGRQVMEAIAAMVKANIFVTKVGMEIKDAHFRGQIDGQITRNNDAARKRRVEAKKAADAKAKADAEAAAAAP